MWRVQAHVHGLLPLFSRGAHWSFVSWRHYNTKTATKEWTQAIENIRNIGIIAHIDAGKTTTTERMLHYAGMTRRIGDVDDGNTVTDYMVQEQERGITIKSAAISFGWNGHRINLIDTPGHVDFTVEVEQAMRVLDGAVTVLDAVQGVQAQTQTVWRQADRRNIPRIVFINKLDRVGADVSTCLLSMRQQLRTVPLLLQMPILSSADSNDGQQFSGETIDLVTMEHLRWRDQEGRQLVRTSIQHPELLEAALFQRGVLIDSISELDDAFFEHFLAVGDTKSVTSSNLTSAIRRLTIAMKVVPVLCGASFRNRGVQPLMDAVIDYLPSPVDRPPVFANDKNNKGLQQITFSPVRSGFKNPSKSDPLCALAFKVNVDKQRGPMVFMRIYSGVLEARAVVFNSTRGVKERINRLVSVYANDVEDVEEVSAGNIAVAIGFKQTATGDTLLNGLEKRLLRLDGLVIPPPVFFRAIEARSAIEEKPLNEALRALLLEDPSLELRVNSDTGQTLLCGQGELHLEIVIDRLKTDHNVNPVIGPVLIAYRESLVPTKLFENHDRMTSVSLPFTYDRELNGKRQSASMTIELSSTDFSLFDKTLDDDETSTTQPRAGDSTVEIRLEEHECAHLPFSEIRDAARDGILNSLSRGPLLGYPVAGVKVIVSKFTITPDTSAGSVIACASMGMRELLRKLSTRLMEPIMQVVVNVSQEHMGNVLSDLTGTRRGKILSIEHMPHEVRIQSEVPLECMVGYASALRSLSSGNASFTQEFVTYRVLSPEQQIAILEKHGIFRPKEINDSTV